jgi:hypothetical protein
MSRVHPAREREIQQKAADLIDDMQRCREESEVRAISELEQLPIDPFAAAIQRGLQLEEVDGFSSDEIRGALVRGTIMAPPRFTPDVRFTVAHEVGHHVLHGGALHLREKRSRPPAGERARRPEIEVEADIFARELLTPGTLVRSVYRHCFGEPIDGRSLSDDIAYFLGIRTSDLFRMTRRDRARLVARATSFGGAQFRALVDLFGVSAEAMAIRLEELRLVF